MGLDEGIEISATVIVGDLVTWLDVLNRGDDDLVLLHVGLSIGPACVIDVAGGVAAAGAVHRPTAVELEQIFGPELVGFRIGDDPAAVIGDELPLLNRLKGKEAETGLRAADAEPAAR